MRKFLFTFFVFVFLNASCLNACNLPAHPSAAAIPTSGTPGMILVEEGNSFYYLVAEGTSANMRIVWDPAMHNRPGGLNTDEYEGVRRAGIDRDTNVPEINGAGFFTLEAMAEFFRAQGNRGDIKEAFSRESGADLSLAFVPDMSLGPFAGLQEFAKADQEQEFSIYSGKVTGYTGNPYVGPTYVSDTRVTSAVNSLLPSRRWHDNTAAIELENGTSIPGPFYDAAAGIKIKYHDCGIYMDGIVIDVTRLEGRNYIAYIDGDNTASRVHVQGIGNGPENGAAGPSFDMQFTTPTITNNKEDSMITIKVKAPPAGFELSNFFWVWEEDVYQYKERTDPVLDASGTPELNPDGTPKTTTKRFYEAISMNEKCSAELKLIVYKPANSQGFSAFRVYDTKGPLTSELSFFDPGPGTPLTSFPISESGNTDIGFNLKFADSNPFTQLTVSENIAAAGAPDIRQSKDKAVVEIFYTYPTYHYTETDPSSFDALTGHGLADLADTAGTSRNFKSYQHTTQWFWKRTTAQINEITKEEEVTKDGKIIGGIFQMKGQFSIPNPKPWHEFSSDNRKFAVFAIAKDSSGHPCQLFSAVVGTNPVANNPRANITSDKPWAFNPQDGAIIPVETSFNSTDIIAAAPWPGTANWQAMNYYVNEDIYAPEIQVIVFDTRTNRHHVFGTGENGAHAFSKSTNKAVNDYAGIAIADLPYLNKEGLITAAHQFTETTPTEDLFNKFLVGPNAVSTITPPAKHGLICQKNTRMLFFARAFDNWGYMEPGAGVGNFSMTLTDKHETKTEGTMMKPIEHIFRYENGDIASGIPAGDEYKLEVTAADKSGNSRTLLLNIGVIGRTLEIRTLEERRNRIE